MANASAALRIGIDLGGTKISGIVLDGDGRVLEHRRVPTPRGRYEDIVEAVAALVETLERAAGAPCRVGVATPGAASPATGLLRNANSTELNGRPFQADLAARLRRPVRIANDANCFALSEAVDGAAAGAEVVFGVIVGTGTGGGIVVGGRVLTGVNAVAGEWGHNPLPWPRDDERPGPPCYCGRRGCIETFLSGPGLAAAYAAAGGERVDAATVAARAEAGEARAAAVLAGYVERMARALAHVINLLDPDVIVLGGGLSKIAALYRDVPARWGDWVFSDVVATRLVPPRHGDDSGVRGAAWLWPANGGRSA
ncbi:MAG: N-acetylglucosamine kinase [Gammaproteobacteria bacterium]|nr:MAG: N-acetylglucosamine kinase [Gammaproteobacteria bacterium]